ncbi:hypothetical protein ACU61A_15785 [Pseudonocardia sichuanensis]
MTERAQRVPLLESVDRTVAALATTDADAAVVHLAQLLAREIDQAGTVARAAAKALRDAAADGDEALVEQVTALRTKLGEREALDRIGARLATLLVELQATPKARAAKGPAAPPAAGGKLAGLRVAK